VNRRQFVILTCTAAAGCASGAGARENAPIRLRPVTIDAGPASGFSAEGVYSHFVTQRFFVVRRGSDLFALSAVCTHRTCRLRAEPDHSFYCKCHGSAFDTAGHVTEGPARRDLPVLPTTIDEHGHLIVHAVA
jgi:Rieske Fe-S protein